MQTDYAPIVLFVYNRVKHVQKVIEGLLQNPLSNFSDIYIFSDAWKDEKSKEEVLQVRRYVHTIMGFRELKIIERQNNYGLKRNITEGVTEIINKYGKVIVLEDDIVPTPFFLEYMNRALELYKDYNSVMEVSASHEYMEVDSLPETFFLKKGFCHGWATWKRAWDKYDKSEDAKNIIGKIKAKQIKEFNLYGATDEFGEIVDNFGGYKYMGCFLGYSNVFE